MRQLATAVVSFTLLALVVPSSRAQQVTLFQVDGEYRLWAPQADQLDPTERLIWSMNVTATAVPEVGDPPGFRSVGRWREPDPPNSVSLDPLPPVPGPPLPPEGLCALDPQPAPRGIVTSHSEGLGAEAVGHLYTLHADIGTHAGLDWYRFDERVTTERFPAAPAPPTFPDCDPDPDDTVVCLQGQDLCECAGLLRVKYVCEETGTEIPVTSSAYPQTGFVEVYKTTPNAEAWYAPSWQARTTVRHGELTRLLVQDYDDEYRIHVDIQTGTDRYSDTFHYIFDVYVPTGMDCLQGGEIEIPLPCGSDDPPGPTCCQQFPGDPCCTGQTTGGVCCAELPCCVRIPDDPCCDPGGTSGQCCSDGVGRGNWQYIGHENQVVYSDETRQPTVRIDRGHWANERLAHVTPPSDPPPYLYDTPASRDLSRFNFHRAFASPTRIPGDPYTGNYRLSGFHVLHDFDLNDGITVHPFDGQPCGPLGDPCGSVQLIWTSSGAGPEAVDAAWSNGEMLWVNCPPGGIFDDPDDEFDWLFLPGGTLPWDVERCDPYPTPGCVLPIDNTEPPNIFIEDPEFQQPFVMQPGTIEGTISLWDGDGINPDLQVLEHLRLDAWAYTPLNNPAGGPIVGAPSFVQALGVGESDPTCENDTAAGNAAPRPPAFPSEAIWGWTNLEQGQVQTNFVTPSGTPTSACVPGTGGLRQFEYRMNPGQIGNVSGLYQQRYRLSFSSGPAFWTDWLLGSTFVLPRRGGTRLTDEVVPGVDPTVTVENDHCQCFGEIQLFLTGENSGFEPIPPRGPEDTGFLPSVTGRRIDMVGDETEYEFLGGGQSFAGKLCPTNNRIALIRIPAIPGDYDLFPSVVWEGAFARTEFSAITTQCDLQCGEVCRICASPDPVCSNPTVVGGQPVVVDPVDCDAPFQVELSVFDCDGDSASTVDVLACTDDANQVDPADPQWVDPADFVNGDPTLGTYGAACATTSCPHPVKFVTDQLIGDAIECSGAANVTLDLTIDGNPVLGCGAAGYCFIVYDEDGNFDNNDDPVNGCGLTVQYEDRTAPTFTCPPDLTVECDDPTDPPDTGEPTNVSDACDPNPTVTHADVVTAGPCPHSWTITRTWTVTDACNQSASCDQIITVVDTTAPQITCPPDVTVECDDPTDPSATGQATAQDNCDPAPVITYSDVITPGSCADSYTITRTWTATDACGNAASCDQIITVQDTTPPQITCPPDVTVECDAPTTPPDTGEPTVSDNCDPAPLVTYSDVITPGSCADSYTITRTWTATDRCGNAASCDQVITVQDTTPPQITCPPDVTVECDDPTTPPDTGEPTVSDNCDPAPTVTYSDVVTPGSCPHEWTITRTWTATDRCGLSSSCDQVITVVDTTAPQITCPPDVTVECDDPTTPPDTGEPTVGDNCDPSPTVTWSDVITPGSCPQNYTITRTWTATDACGNSASCDQIITVQDTTPPTATCPPDITICPEAPPPPPDPSLVVTSDNCGTVTVEHVDDVSDGNSCPETITRTYVARDECGNERTCTQRIIRDDVVPPTIVLNTPPDPPDPGCHAGPPQPWPLCDCLWPANHKYWCFDPDDYFTVMDDCGPITLDVTTTGGSGPCDAVINPLTGEICLLAEGDRGGDRIYEIFVTATDACNNVAGPVKIGEVRVPHDMSSASGCQRPDTHPNDLPPCP